MYFCFLKVIVDYLNFIKSDRYKNIQTKESTFSKKENLTSLR